MLPVFVALGLFNVSEPLDTGKMGKHRTWNAREMVPFSARMVVERLACGSKMRGGDVEEQSKEREYVRVMVNDAVQPLGFCGVVEREICRLGCAEEWG